MALPSDLTYGFVVGRFLLAVGDAGYDGDRRPDALAAAGSVKLSPVKSITLSTASPASTVIAQPVTAKINPDGAITDPGGNVGVWLVCGTYDVVFSFVGVTLPAFQIHVTPAHTPSAPLDLSLSAPLTPDPTVKFVVNERVYLDTLAAAAQAAETLARLESSSVLAGINFLNHEDGTFSLTGAEAAVVDNGNSTYTLNF